MPLTIRSKQLAGMLAVVHAGVRAAHLRAPYADDAVQQTLVALLPQLERLVAMSERERAAYVFVAASRTAMALRRRVGVEKALGTDGEVAEWSARHSTSNAALPSPEHRLASAQSALRAEQAFGAMETRDREIVRAVANDGLSEREVALQLGISRGNVAYRLRRAREALGRAWFGTTSWPRKGRPT